MADSSSANRMTTTQSLRASRRSARENSLLELRAILDNATVGILFTRNRLLVQCNSLCAEMFGYRVEEFLGLPGRSIYPSNEVYEALAAEVGPILAQGKAYRSEIEMRRRDGRLFWCKVSAKAIDPNRPSDGTIWIMEDVTRDRTLRDALRQSTSELVSIFDTALIGIAVVRHGCITRCNSRLEALLGYAQGSLPGQSVRSLYPSEQKFMEVRAEFSDHLTSGETCRAEHLLLRRDGESFWARISGRVFDALDIHQGSVWLVEDITEQKRAAVRMQQALEEQNMIFDNAAVGIMFLRNRVLFRCNRKLAEISGYEQENLIGQSTRIFYFSEEEYLAHIEQFGPVLARGEVYIGEVCVRHANGQPIWARVTGRKADAVEGVDDADVVWIVEDITERRRAEEMLTQAHEMLEQRVIERTAELAEANAHLQEEVYERMRAEQRIWQIAHHDALTGLPNRALLQDRLAQVLTNAERNSERVAVMFLDLDRFKSINDSLGHDVGDELLKSVAFRLQSVVRSVDTVCRLGGDEFVIVLTQVATPDDAVLVAEKILSVLAPTVHIHGHELRATTSIGISLFPDDGADAFSLMKNADTAMYHAKTEGRNNFQFFTQRMNEEAQRFFNLEQRLRAALANEQFVLYFQPIVDHRSGQLVNLESLVRWEDPEFGLVSPSEFVRVAEEAGLIIAMGEWVLKSALMQNRDLQAQGFPRIPVAVNLSPRQFRHRGLIDSVRNALDASGQPAELLEIEITESALMHDVEECVRKLNELVGMGVRIAIDDFGTGYSNLSLLTRFPVSKLKIDHTFVREVCHDRDSAAIVAAILGLAQSLGLDTVAEGVETEGQINFLTGHGCFRHQGYYYSPPVPGALVSDLLHPDRFMKSAE